MNTPQKSIRLISFNILYDYGADKPFSWQARRELVFSLLRFHAPGIFCLQEPLQNQVEDISDNFRDYSYLSFGCGDGVKAGQHMSVFFLTEKFDLLDSGRFGLSETPDKLGLIGWDAKNPRLALWMKLLQRDTKGAFYVMNTHLDHVGETARQRSALLLSEKAKEIAEGSPLLLCGDFNANENSQTYKNLIDGGFTDCSNLHNINDLPYTYHRFLFDKSGEKVENPEEKYRDDPRVLKIIDHIFYKGAVQVLRHGILSDNYFGAYPSDHLPKMCDFLI